MSTNQTTIFDQAEKKKQEGIELVYRHANTFWKRAAAEQLQKVINNCETFTSDHIIMPLEKKGITTADTRALAAILIAAKKMNLIEATDNFVRCQRKSRHNAPIMVWRVIKRPV